MLHLLGDFSQINRCFEAFEPGDVLVVTEPAAFADVDFAPFKLVGQVHLLAQDFSYEQLLALVVDHQKSVSYGV